eukprot:1954549-Rhodomonas_salina.2
MTFPLPNPAFWCFAMIQRSASTTSVASHDPGLALSSPRSPAHDRADRVTSMFASPGRAITASFGNLLVRAGRAVTAAARA